METTETIKDLRSLRLNKRFKQREVVFASRISSPTMSLIEHGFIKITEKIEKKLIKGYLKLGLITEEEVPMVKSIIVEHNKKFEFSKEEEI